MEKIEAGNALHRAFSVFLFNSKYELLLQVFTQY
jgi:isopentenyl-diphosphate Delta-isomerase